MFVISTCSHNFFHDFVSCNDGSITVGYKGTDLYEVCLNICCAKRYTIVVPIARTDFEYKLW